jgi:hypothetical protein
MNASEPIENVFLTSAITSFQSQKDLADRAVVQLTDDQMQMPLDRNTNSIAVIMKHIAGNLVSRWTDFLTTDGEKPERNRDGEFVDTFRSREELLEHWERGWRCLFDALDNLQPEDLAKTVTIRDEPHTVPLAIHRSLAHCGYHVGQIVLMARVYAKDKWQTLTMPRAETEALCHHRWQSESAQSE